MPDWLNWSNAVAAIPLQVLGFSIAFWQIAKARTAAEAAESAAKDVSQEIRAKLLLVVLPQLSQVETNLEWAVSRCDRDAAVHYLGTWRWQAGQARGLLVSLSHDVSELLGDIQSSITVAAETKLQLQGPDEDVRKRCKSAQRAIAVVTGSIGELSARHSVEGSGQS